MTSTDELLKELIKSEEKKLKLLQEKNESTDQSLRDGIIIFILIFGIYFIGSSLIIFLF